LRIVGLLLHVGPRSRQVRPVPSTTQVRARQSDGFLAGEVFSLQGKQYFPTARELRDEKR